MLYNRLPELVLVVLKTLGDSSFHTEVTLRDGFKDLVVIMINTLPLSKSTHVVDYIIALIFSYEEMESPWM